MRIQHNITAMNAYRNYNTNTKALAKNLEKLSSGYRINRAGDDAAGLAISEKMRAQITGLEVAQKNAKDGISLVQTAEGAMTEVHDMLNRMYELAEQSANGTYADEVDREQMQKEIDSLSDEINRIAESTNFNGIKLLNGKLGLNEEAFTDIQSGQTPLQSSSIDVSKLLAKKGSAAPDLHLGGSPDPQTNPSFEIDFADAEFKATADGALKMDVVVAGKTISLEFTGLNAGDAKNATDVASAFATEFNKEVVSTDGGTSGAKDAGKITVGGKDYVFSANASSGKVTFTFKGTNASGTYEQASAGKLTADQVLAINGAMVSDVKVNNFTNGTQTAGKDYHHAVENITLATVAGSGGKAGIDFTLDNTVVKDGNILKIDDKEFVFKTDKDSSVTAASGQTLIDVSDQEVEADQIKEAVQKLSKGVTTNFHIGAKNGTDNKIHIDQVTSSSNVYDTYEKLAAVISAREGSSYATSGAGTKISITAGEIQEGDALKVGDQTYVFTADTTGKTDDAAKGIYYVQDGTNAAKNLASKINSVNPDSNTSSKFIAEASAGGDSVTVYAKATTEKKSPIVAGKGLTLQIGDTSDDFNKLTVEVNDMHVAAMGLGDISVASQDKASDAMKAIKEAINYVSDTRGDLGSLQNRLDHTISNLSTMQENIQDAEATIRDVDVAEEMMAYTKNNILVQSAQAMLAQANQLPQGVLQLLQ